MVLQKNRLSSAVPGPVWKAFSCCMVTCASRRNPAAWSISAGRRSPHQQAPCQAPSLQCLPSRKWPAQGRAGGAGRRGRQAPEGHERSAAFRGSQLGPGDGHGLRLPPPMSGEMWQRSGRESPEEPSQGSPRRATAQATTKPLPTRPPALPGAPWCRSELCSSTSRMRVSLSRTCEIPRPQI